jgi:hypothetical protein
MADPEEPQRHDDDQLIGRLRDDLKKIDPGYPLFQNAPSQLEHEAEEAREEDSQAPRQAAEGEDEEEDRDQS